MLTHLSDFLQQARSVGVKVDAALQAKLENALQAVSDKKLKVALIGGFSEENDHRCCMDGKAG